MYYDIVISVYKEKESSDKCNVRIDSRLVCGGFGTEEEARSYISDNEITEVTSSDSGERLCLEIEGHNDDGSLIYVSGLSFL